MIESDCIFSESEIRMGPSGVVLIRVFSGLRKLDFPFGESGGALTAA